jgi:glycosyltransferase involved in cell wall biosynthesis
MSSPMCVAVSIIIASYNKGPFIVETVNSVLGQTFLNFEIIIVDDCSTDNSVELVSQNLSDQRIKLIQNPVNSGANYCRNVGIEKAQGAYIIFLDADDLLMPFALENRIKAAEQYPEANLLVFTMGVFEKTLGDDKRCWIPRSKNPLSDFLQHKLPWAIVQPLWKRDFLLELEGFDESFERLQDVELHTRALLHSQLSLKSIGGTPDCYYRIDATRKIFTEMEFLKRWAISASKYYEKFIHLVPLSLKSKIIGTILQTYLQILWRYKNNRINTRELKELENLLFAKIIMNPTQKLMINVLRRNNTRFLKIPGLNVIIKLAIK